MTNTKAQIISLGRDYIQQIGYPSFSFRQIAGELGIKNAAVHYHFPAKEDLGVAVIEKDRSDFEAMGIALQHRSPVEKAEAVLKLYEQYFNNGQKLCLIGICGSAYSELPSKMQVAAKLHLQNISIWLEETFAAGKVTGEFKFQSDPKTMATQWVNMLPGTLISGRILGREYFFQSQSTLRQSLNSI
jgi:TetR/AcrR family transcriptional repressor of nem operon